jgi:acetyl-CoA C-acetyltransferase
LKLPGIDFDTIAASPMLWDPIRYLETCPSSDGACAIVFGSEKVASKAPNPPAWVQGSAMRTEPTMFSGRDQVNPGAGQLCAKELFEKVRITDPRGEIDCCEIYVPFSWFEPMWMETIGFAKEGHGWEMTAEGATALDGDLPVNMSGGVLSTNPIGASGMLRFAESANQIRGLAGEHQVPDVKRALGHAYGGGSQFFSMWVVGSDPL